MLIVVTIVAGQGVWRDHIAVQLTKEKAEVARAEADKAKEEAAKAMWEHYVPVDHQPPSAKQ